MTAPTLPTLTIVTGRPGAGKTTLARKLAEHIHCPLIGRDMIKEGIVNTTGDKGTPGGSLAWDACITFFATIELLLNNRVTIVAEGFLGQQLWAQHMPNLTALARVRLIQCQVEPELAHSRVIQRRLADLRWDEFHNTPVNQTQKPAQNYALLDLGVPTLVVDCTNQYTPSFDDIFRFTQR
ncbi:MAG: AAA family ATPase [Opitutaceae bacterium]|nr:AAA family ATPase [Opitutaceae bacterium]